MKRSLLLLVIAFSVFTAVAGDQLSRKPRKIINSVIKIYSRVSRPNYYQPWQNLQQQVATGSGFLISENRIITNAHTVANQTFLMVSKPGDSKRYIARLEAIGHECDLAVLKVDDSSFYNNLQPLEFAGLPNLQDNVHVLGYPVGGENVSLTEGVISRIEPIGYIHSGRRLLAVQIDAAINPGNSGGPVVNSDNKVVGVAFQNLSKSQSIGYMIPVSVIRHFLTDIADGKFDGFPDFPLNGSLMENPDLRKWADMTEDQSGVLVNKIDPAIKDFCPLKAGDVIMKIDGVLVANNGTVPFRDGDVIFFGNLIWEKYIGEKCIFTVLRKGKVMELEYTLRTFKSLVPPPTFDKLPTYYLLGGMLFMPLTVNYLSSWSKWIKNAPFYLKKYVFEGEITPERDQVVVLSFVLADESNVGYQDIRHMPIKKVNGATVKNLEHFIATVESMKSGFLVMELDNHETVVLDIAKARNATARVMQRYRIPADRSADLNAGTPQP